MKLSNLQTELDFLRALKASCQFYWATVRTKQLAVTDILEELRPQRKTDRQADRWWHQYQNMRATMSDTVGVVSKAIKFVREMEERHGIDVGWSWDEPSGSRCLVMAEPLCAACEAEPLLDIDWMQAPNEKKRFWRILDYYSNDYRVGTSWIATQQAQVDVLPQSAFRDDLELAYSKLRFRLTEACNCSAMVASREFDNRGVKATNDDGRMAFIAGPFRGAGEAVLDRVQLCTNCASNVVPMDMDTKTALEKVLDRRAKKRPIGA